jgi:hypothetical protein
VADLSLRLRVFIASPNDVVPERRAAEQQIGALVEECARRRLLVSSYLWERDGRPSLDRPQTYLNEELRSAELTIVILWSRLGAGTSEEFERAAQQVRSGASDEVLLYFKTAPPPPEANSADVESVRRFKSGVTNFALDFETVEEFRERLAHDLRLWLERWQDVPDICQYALHNSAPASVPPAYLGENRYARLRMQFVPEREAQLTEALGRAAVERYQADGLEAYALPIGPEVIRGVEGWKTYARPKGGNGDPRQAAPLLAERGEVYFGDAEWFLFFCAAGLVDALRRGRVDAVDRRPYLNPAHQLFKVLAQPHRGEIIATLRKWLLNVNDVTFARPVARNFAAYVLGMMGAIEAQDDLAEALRRDEGEDVRLYCVTSLGKVRARRQLPVLVKVYNETPDRSMRLVTAQAVCRMVGIANYEL